MCLSVATTCLLQNYRVKQPSLLPAAVSQSVSCNQNCHHLFQCALEDPVAERDCQTLQVPSSDRFSGVNLTHCGSLLGRSEQGERWQADKSNMQTLTLFQEHDIRNLHVY